MSESPGASAIPAPGDVLAEKYSITRVIGQGGMGCVVAARHLLLNQDVAIKFLLPHGAEDPQFVRRFLREAQTAASIRSEHVVRVLDMGVLGDGVPYMVMEYLDGEDLGARIDTSGPLSVEEAVDLTLQACEALAEAHAAGLAHRDIKPSNLFVTRRSDGSPLLKLLDFGIAKRASSIDGSLTATGVMMGSPSYMSPEQVRDAKTVDARTDIWSLGATLHELLTGDPPFTGTTFSALCAAIISDAAPPLREKRADAPAELEAAVLRCLEKDPAKRFADVGALADALAPFAGSLGHVSAGRARRVLSSSGAVEGKTNLASASRVSAPPASKAAAEPFAQTEVSSTTALGEGRRSVSDEPRAGRSRAIVVGALLAVASGTGVFVALMRNTTEIPAGPSGDATEAPSISANVPEALAPTRPPTANTPLVTAAASADSVAPPGAPAPSDAPLSSSATVDAGAPPVGAKRPAALSSAPRQAATSVPTTTPKKGPANADPFADQH